MPCAYNTPGENLTGTPGTVTFTKEDERSTRLRPIATVVASLVGGLDNAGSTGICDNINGEFLGFCVIPNTTYIPEQWFTVTVKDANHDNQDILNGNGAGLSNTNATIKMSRFETYFARPVAGALTFLTDNIGIGKKATMYLWFR